LKELPAISTFVFTDKLKAMLNELFGPEYFVVKSIYFDKPEQSNWFVNWHQDLTISVKEKKETNGFGPWTIKQDQFAVQPPLGILNDNFTIRIHLDDATAENGALKVIPGSHKKNIYRADEIDWAVEKEHICPVRAGGIMIMQPLLLHASNRTVNYKRRRVIHIEFSRTELPKGLSWAEKLLIE
jgi:ectoine hydroxylase-related dioxygenase (phytanoyl-CoA dioxygenase family)